MYAVSEEFTPTCSSVNFCVHIVGKTDALTDCTIYTTLNELANPTKRIYGELQKSKQDDADKENNNKFELTY